MAQPKQKVRNKMRLIILMLFLALSLTSCNQVAKVDIKGTEQEVKEVKPKAQKPKTFTDAVFEGDPELFAEIKSNASKKFPDDYITQKFIIEKQCKSYSTVLDYPWKIEKDENTDKIWAKAYDQYGRNHDYITMLFILNEQLKAYIAIK